MNPKLNKIRRSDRQETDKAFLIDLLENSISCSIAVETGDYPLIHVAFFAYDNEQDDIVFHFSKYGYAGEQLLDGKKVTVSLYKYGKLYTASKAVDFGCEYMSAIIRSHLRIIEDEGERMKAMQLFFNKFFVDIQKSDYTEFTTTEMNPVMVARIKVENWLGKQHRVPETKAKKSFYPKTKPLI